MKSSRGYTLALLAAPICQVALLTVAASRSRYYLNQDATFIIRFASYYINGRFDLAVCGWFGPMLSWIIAPLLKVVNEPIIAARIAMLLSAVIFLLGSIRVLQRLQLSPAWVVLGAWVTATTTVYWSVMVITPDLLFGGVLLFAVSEMVSERWLEGRWSPFVAGLVAGLSYLAKPVGFPTAIALIFAAATLWIVIRQGTRTAVLRSVGLTLVGFFLVATPWVIALSAKYGGVTITTAARANHSLAGPTELEQGFPTALRKPAPGRFAWGEDPSEMTSAMTAWSPLDSWSHAKYQVHLILFNALQISMLLARFDELHFGVAALLWGLLVHTPWREQLRADRWRWSGALVGCMCGVYLPVAATEFRYYLLTFPLLFAAAAGMVTALTDRPLTRLNVPWLIGFALVALSFLDAQRGDLSTALHGMGDPPSTYAHDLAVKLRAKGIHGPVAGAGDYDDPWTGEGVGVYLAFFLNEPFYGSDPHPTARNFEVSEAALIVIDRKAQVVAELSGDRNFVDLDPVLFASGSEADRYPLKVFHQPGQNR